MAGMFGEASNASMCLAKMYFVVKWENNMKAKGEVDEIIWEDV
jgi:hypothetical protein